MAKENFEKSMNELENIVSQLEKGELSLDEMLGCFETGIKLSKSCASMLDEAEKKVNILLKDGNGEILKGEFPQGDQ